LFGPALDPKTHQGATQDESKNQERRDNKGVYSEQNNLLAPGARLEGNPKRAEGDHSGEEKGQEDAAKSQK
jgi:hypothetical protein